MRPERKIGILVLVSLGVLVFFLIKMGSLSSIFEPKGYEIYSFFDSLAGLQERAPVRLAGVKIGYVEKISLRGGRALVTMRIYEKYRIKKGSRAAVTSMGIMGEKYIEIFPGKGVGFIKKGEEIKGIPPLSIDQLGTMFYAIAQDVKSLSRTFSEVLGGRKGRASLDSILTNLDSITSQLNQVLRANRNNISLASRELLDSLRELKASLRSFSEASKNLASISREYKGKSKEIEEATREVTRLSRRAMQLIVRANKMLEKIQQGEGTLGKVFKDEKLYMDTRRIIENTSKITSSLDEKIESANFSMHPYIYFSSEKLGRVGFEALRNEDYLRAGLVIREDNSKTYDLLFGKRYEWFSVSSGVIEGSFGVSASLYSRGGLFISGELYNPSSVKYRILFGARRNSFSIFGGYSRDKKLLFGVSYGF